MHRADIIVLTPPAWIDSSFAIAACRSGAKGYLDVEYATEQQAWEQLRRLELYAPRRSESRSARKAPPSWMPSWRHSPRIVWTGSAWPGEGAGTWSGASRA